MQSLWCRLCYNSEGVFGAFAFDKVYSIHFLPQLQLPILLRWVGVMVVGQDCYSESSFCKKNFCRPHCLQSLQTTVLSIIWLLWFPSTLPQLLSSPKITLEIESNYSRISTPLYLSFSDHNLLKIVLLDCISSFVWILLFNVWNFYSAY